MQLDKLLRFIPRRHRIWASIALIAGVLIARHFGFVGEGGLSDLENGRQSSRDFSARQGSGVLTGRPKVVDGDSFKLGRDEIRLLGIDAPEGRQMCQKAGRPWACGEASRTALVSMIGARDVSCVFAKRDRHDRALAYCKSGALELNREMVSRGFAVSYGKFRREEKKARSDKRGIWASKFQRPKAWRASRGIGR
ncbi:MAG: thermonuclease family protein [Hyphomicrobiaceae bacterium]